MLALLVAFAVAVGWWWHQRREHSQDAPILAAARRYGVDPSLVKAVVWRESWFNPRARGRKGEIGLMQIRKGTAQEWANTERISPFHHELLLDPATNAFAGTWYLEKLVKRYARTDHPLPYVLADYNAGRSNVLRWNKGVAVTNSARFLEQVDFRSTRNYVRSVLKRQGHYRRQGFGTD